MMMRENEKSMRTLAMLRYQADRYQSVGNGSMCQRVNAEIRRLVSQIDRKSTRLNSSHNRESRMPSSA